MAFDGIFLNRLIKEIKFIETARITKILEISDNTFILTLRKKENLNLLISLNSSSSRCHITTKEYNHIESQKPFTLILKKNLEGSFIKEIYQYESDRLLILKCEGYNEMKDRTTYFLIVELMGKYSNLILIDQNYKIIDSLHKGSIDENNRLFIPNATYKFPETNKINPLNLSITELKNYFENIQNIKQLTNTFLGVSKGMYEDIFNCEDHALEFYNRLHNYYNPSSFNLNNKSDYYFYSKQATKEYNNLSLLLDDIFYENDKKEQIRKQTNDLERFINNRINKLNSKIKKLNEELLNTNKMDDFKLYGELLLSYHNLKERTKEVKILNYYNSTYVTIKLEDKYTVLENSNRYYKKYQKTKKSISYINEQIKQSKNELIYFEELAKQISYTNLNDVLEILEELKENRYINNNNKNNRKKRRKPNITAYNINGTKIYVGKNNIQNDYLTHKLAKPNWLWFHVKDGSGSHVVIAKDNDYTEAEIRAAALLASYYSYAKDSSSVAVDYTKIKFIKKIPGLKGSFVTYSKQNTIYIDPDFDTIKEFRKDNL